MALDVSYFLVIPEIAKRTGVLDSRYYIADGRYVMDNKDLSYIRFSTEEIISGLEGIERVEKSAALTLIAENGYKMGVQDKAVESETSETEIEEDNQEQVVEESENEEESEIETTTEETEVLNNESSEE